MTTAALLLAFLADAIAGFLFGRWWAETRRAQRDMRRTWRARKTYRKGRW